MIRDEVKELLESHDKRTFIYFSKAINFFYSEFDNLTPDEKRTLYKELEDIRNYLNSPRPHKVKLKDGTIVEQKVISATIERQDVFPPIYERYEEYLKTRTKNIEQRTTNIEPQIQKTFKQFIFSLFSSLIPTVR